MSPPPRWLKAVVDGLFPPRCVACDGLGARFMCPACEVAAEPDGPFDLEGFERAHAGFRYGGTVSEAIVRWKFGGAWWLGAPLAHAIRAGVEAVRTDAWVPVPLTRHRLRARGFNQAVELARHFGGPVWHVVQRARTADPSAQTGRTRQQRLRARPGFELRPGARIRGCRVTVVDDVATTGTTARAMAQVLLKAGAQSVSLIVVARTERDP